ncbi:helix-turn-helix domain-containing protein [Brachybacterium huguangmaarense]
MPPRFVPLSDVAEMLSISASQAYALVRSGELRAIKVGGRGQWRVEQSEIEAYIERSYAETERQLALENALEQSRHEASSPSRTAGTARG